MRCVVGVALVGLAMLLPTPARAIDRDACAVPYEQAQLLRKQRIFLAAQEQLDACRAQCPAVLAADCTQWAAELKALTPTVRLQVHNADGHPIDGFRTMIDGTVLSDARGDSPAAVDPGEHLFRVEASGFKASEVRATLNEGEHGRVIDVTVIPIMPSVPVVLPGVAVVPPSAPRSDDVVPPSRTASHVLGGIGVAGLGAGGVLALAGFIDKAELRGSCAPHCSRASVSTVETMWVAGGISAGVGAASLAVAGLLWSRAKPRKTGVTWVPVVGLGSLELAGQF